MKILAWMVVLLAWMVRPVSAQTTQPAPASWDQTIQSLAKSLANGDDDRGLLGADCFMRSFESSSPKQFADVLAHTNGAALLMAKPYLFPGGAIATDIAASVSDSK